MKPSARPNARQQEEQQRRELMSGATEPVANRAGDISQDVVETPEPTTQQLVNQAVSTHKDSTATVNRGVKIVEETRQLQAETLAKLEHQGRQMENIEKNVQVINVELSYSEKLLIYMRRCCCWSLCDCITGADPEANLKTEWKQRVEQGKVGTTDGLYVDPPAKLAAAAAAAQGKPSGSTMNGRGTPEKGEAKPGPRHRDPDIRLPEGMESTELRLHDETRKQNQALDQIHKGLDDILRGAEQMGVELERHNQQLDRLDVATERTHGRIVEVNNKSQLAEFRTKENREKNDSMSLKSSILKYAMS